MYNACILYIYDYAEISIESSLSIEKMLGIGSPKPSLSSSIRVEDALLTIVVFFACIIVGTSTLR